MKSVGNVCLFSLFQQIYVTNHILISLDEIKKIPKSERGPGANSRIRVQAYWSTWEQFPECKVSVTTFHLFQ